MYVVYILADGTVEDMWEGDSFDRALCEFDKAVSYARTYDTTAEQTVHLYEPAYGYLHAEVTI